jgi:diphosphomevalonate decarboxylase
VPVFFTIDAGPQVKIVTIPEYETKVSSFLAQMPEIERIISTRLGGNAYVIEDA